jgi:thiol-disulfide isomerase/thioredoxin
VLFINNHKNIMNVDLKSNIAIVFSIIAIVLSSLGGGLGIAKTVEGPAANIKLLAKEAGLSGRSYEKCIVDPSIATLVQEDIDETNAIVAFAELQGIGTPFNLVITDTQAIPVSGAYPYEFFNLMVQQFNETGTITQETLDQFQIVPFDYGITEVVRGFDTNTDHYKGSENPEITIIEFSDYECPFCSKIHPTLEQIVEENTNIAWIYRHLPLGFHDQAFPSAIASECVAKEEGNDAFWDFTDSLFANQSLITK